MFELKDLYQEVIVDHNRAPRNFRRIEHPTCVAEGYNPLCGDRLTVYLTLRGDVIEDVAFEGEGCAISVASASLMTESLKGKTIAEAASLFDGFHDLLTGKSIEEAGLGKLAALIGVREYPSRVKCATLCWHAIKSALAGQAAASTE